MSAFVSTTFLPLYPSSLSFCRPVSIRPPLSSRPCFLSRRCRPLQMRMSSPPPVSDRLLSSLPYLIPLLDSLSFGASVFSKFPLLANLLLPPLLPLYNIYRGIPFLAFGVFLALFVLVVRNTSISRYIRFNTYQALIIDIALIFPQLFQGVNLAIPKSITEVCSTAVFYAVFLAVGYAVVTNAKGEVPDDIPGISDSVYRQMGPY